MRRLLSATLVRVSQSYFTRKSFENINVCDPHCVLHVQEKTFLLHLEQWTENSSIDTPQALWCFFSKSHSFTFATSPQRSGKTVQHCNLWKTKTYNVFFFLRQQRGHIPERVDSASLHQRPSYSPHLLMPVIPPHSVLSQSSIYSWVVVVERLLLLS